MLPFNTGGGSPTKLYVIGGIDGNFASDPTLYNDVWTSLDGVSWDKTTANSFFTPRSKFALSKNNDYFLLSGGQPGGVSNIPLSDVWKSTDLIIWEKLTSTAVFGKIYNHQMEYLSIPDKFVVFGGVVYTTGDALVTDVFTSSDGASWTNVTAPVIGQPSYSPRQSGESSVLGSNIYYIGGYDDVDISQAETLSDVYSSSTASSWSKLNVIGGSPWGARFGHGIVAFKDKLWILGGKDGVGTNNEVWSSSDGLIWERVTDSAGWDPRYNFGLVVFFNQLWVIGGDDGTGTKFNDAWRSSDGETWTEASMVTPFPARDNFACYLYGSKIHVVAGEETGGVATNAVYRAEFDGNNTLTWSTTTTLPAGDCALRSGCRAVVNNGKVYLFGGRDGTTESQDTFVSDDGITFSDESLTFGTPPDARYNHTMISKESKVWLLGGHGDSAIKFNDIWSLDPSLPAPEWTLLTASAVFSERDLSAGAVFDNKIYINSGRDASDDPIQDLYASSTGAGSKKTVFIDDVMTPFWKGRDVYIVPSIHTDGKRWMWGFLERDTATFDGAAGTGLELDVDDQIQYYTELGPEGFMEGRAGWANEANGGNGAVQVIWDTNTRSLSLINEHSTKVHIFRQQS
jgi:N-acetylneuraminic acid mutarotase